MSVAVSGDFGEMTGVAQARKPFLTFERTATDRESSLPSTDVHATSLPPNMFTRPRQDANDSFVWVTIMMQRNQIERAHRLPLG